MTLFEPEPDIRRRLSASVWFAAWAVVTIIGLTLHADPNGHGTHQQLGLMPCFSALIFDRPCPGCGLTTSWVALLHGDLNAAFHAHALGPLLYLGFTVSAILILIASLTQRRLVTHGPRMNLAMQIFLAVFLTYGLGRMALTPHYATQGERILAQFTKNQS